MATRISHDSRYATASILTDENGVQFIDWMEEIQFDVSNFSDNETYKVEDGDTVFTIASAFYKKQQYYWVVCIANEILNPFEKLTPGAKFILPSFKTFKSKILGGGV